MQALYWPVTIDGGIVQRNRTASSTQSHYFSAISYALLFCICDWPWRPCTAYTNQLFVS